MTDTTNYRIKATAMALVLEGGRYVPRPVPAGAIVAMDSRAPADRLVDVVWNDRTV